MNNLSAIRVMIVDDHANTTPDSCLPALRYDAGRGRLGMLDVSSYRESVGAAAARSAT